MLSSLPVEILERIITYSEIEDIFELRLTCRYINSVSLVLAWRHVTITSCDDFNNASSENWTDDEEEDEEIVEFISLQNTLLKYWMDNEEPVEFVTLYKDYIRKVDVVMQGHERVKWCETVPEILDLIWRKASGVQTVNILLEQSFLQANPVAYDWLPIITGPFHESDPSVVAVEYFSAAQDNDSSFFKDMRSTVLMIVRIKNLKIFKFKLLHMALDVGLFRDVGRHITHFEFAATPYNFINFNAAIEHCTNLLSLDLSLREVFNKREGNYEYRLPDSVRSVIFSSGVRFLNTINGAQVTRLVLPAYVWIKVRGNMPNLTVIEINGLDGCNPEAVKCFKSLVKTCRDLKTIHIDQLPAHVATQIADILDHRFQIAKLTFRDLSVVEAMCDVPASTMEKTGNVQADIMRKEDAENTTLLWHYLALLLKKVPGMARLRLSIESQSSPPLPGYAKQLRGGCYEVDLDRVKQRLLESPTE